MPGPLELPVEQNEFLTDPIGRAGAFRRRPAGDTADSPRRVNTVTKATTPGAGPALQLAGFRRAVTLSFLSVVRHRSRTGMVLAAAV